MELTRLAELARQDAGRKFYSIAHLLTTEALWEAFDNLRKDAAAGVDGVTYAEYEEHLVENLGKLHEKLKSKTYRAQPLRRIYIPKEDGRQRPISIPSLEDKIVQKAAGDLVNAIYEQDFLNCSYGFRPGRGSTINRSIAASYGLQQVRQCFRLFITTTFKSYRPLDT